MYNSAKITFHGGAGSVTGANFLFEVDGKKILIDCGLSQGPEIADDANWVPFKYNPKEIDILFVTHSHIDHIGKIPKLIHEGFAGKIFSTGPTRALAKPMLEDTGDILAKNPLYDLDKIYNALAIKKIFSLWVSYDYHQKIKITDNLEAEFKNAGHILGSAMIEFNNNGKKILFTGDLGNSPSPLLPDTEAAGDVDYLIIESVYGDRNHESRNDRKELLVKVIIDNYKRKGTLIIPTFSLERSQELLFELNDLVSNSRIPVMPIFFDSPLAIRLTEIFKEYSSYFNENAQKVLSRDKYLFDFPGLHSTLKSEDSKMINSAPNPKIIIAGSGMSSGGRIVHHERHFLPDPNNTILLTGYQSLHTIGRQIQEGAKVVRITGEDVRVRAHVENIFGYSGHKDSDHLLQFIENSSDNLKKVFAVMGEPGSSLFLVQKIKDNLGIGAYAPKEGESVDLLFEKPFLESSIPLRKKIFSGIKS